MIRQKKRVYRYIGSSPNVIDPKAFEGERVALKQFRKSPIGCSKELRNKRMERDPFNQLVGRFIYTNIHMHTI